MTDKTFFNGVANGKSDVVQALLDILVREGIPYCVIGGLAVNAYAEPVVSLDLDIVVAARQFGALKDAAVDAFEVREFEHSVNLYSPDSDLRIQVQTDERYQDFVSRAETRRVLGYDMKVASLEDVLTGKMWAYQDQQRRGSKRQKDLADIFRLVEAHPRLEPLLTDEIRAKM